jgi:hypothetical protein
MIVITLIVSSIFRTKSPFSIKYDWIKKNKLGGVGIWALGYDNGYSDLWDILAEKFSEESEKQDNTLYNNK